MKSITEFKEMAFNAFKVEKKLIPSSVDPILFLYSLEWSVPLGLPFNENDVAKMNLNLDERGCFGRAVKAAVIAETHFPKINFYSGEVCQDLLRTLLIASATPRDWCDETYLNEILQYEAPHHVVIYSNRQFDPSFKYISLKPEDLSHPSILKHNLWGALHASYLVSEAFHIKNPYESLKFLLKAREIYPENILIKENIAGRQISLGNYHAAIGMIKESAKLRKDAKMLWVLYNLTGDEHYKKRIVREYNKSMFNYLNKLIS